ncbi:helix-turn-helix domain-containing protein, partial [Pedobacter sp. CAN_A7]
MIKKKKHSFEFKLDCVKQMMEHHRSANSIAEEYGISSSLIEDWLLAH